jgi:hypothetical protein
MSKLFWDHLIHFEELLEELKTLPFSSQEQAELVELIDSTFHHHILEEILSALPRDEHDRFMEMFSDRPDNHEILVYIMRFVPDIEARITNRSLQVKDILRQEIHDTKKRHLDRLS